MWSNERFSSISTTTWRMRSSCATARASCDVARAAGAARVVLAVPVVAADVLPALRRSADEVVFVAAPDDFRAVGEWYADFTQVPDEEVSGLLQVSPSAGP